MGSQLRKAARQEESLSLWGVKSLNSSGGGSDPSKSVLNEKMGSLDDMVGGERFSIGHTDHPSSKLL